MHTDVKACDGTQGRMDTVIESALKVDREKNPSSHQGIEPASVACQSDALPTELHPRPRNFHKTEPLNKDVSSFKTTFS